MSVVVDLKSCQVQLISRAINHMLIALTVSRPSTGFQLVLEPFEWGKGGPGGGRPLLQLHTPTAAAARFSLPAGRHLACLLTNPHSLYALDLRCSVPFQLDTLDKVCSLLLLAAC